ncbi:hypothetical protein O6H91_17G068800 [Diphasiastrum complanatum]|uniref:Uncharacterized protein n=2 Tax=Diphasiastrum complanatum TaxID=34168 RepID=A0ACC2B8R1_DIPCM|nr:hypothetical protein O6H91_17G068800 [Diphasiastrum complanatum]
MALPDLNFVLRGPDGLSLLIGPPFVGEPRTKVEKLPCSTIIFSDDGSRFAVSTTEKIVIYDSNLVKDICSFAVSSAVAISFSPCGTYIQSFQKASGDQKNFTIWNINTGVAVLLQSKKAFSKSSWPLIQFSQDETVACQLVTNEVHLFDAKDFSKGIVDRLRFPGIDGLQLSRAPPSHLATYVRENKGAPASVCIFSRLHLASSQPVARRSFFKASTANMMWNQGSTALLVVAHSDVDKTNKSYYGESRVHFLTTDGSHEGSVPLSKEGPVHDAQWSPTGKDFVVVYGFMPAKVTLFDTHCNPLFEFGTGSYNTVRWNPHGRFVCLAGFGNLPGDMAFWDRNTLKLLGTTKASCSVSSEWSSDGRYLMTATTMPRMQVDNGFKVFKYNGSLYFEKKIDKLYEVLWRPAVLGTYPDRPPSPSTVNGSEQGSQKGTMSAKATVKPAAYRPPHSSHTAAVRAQLFGEDPESSGELSKSALKNKKRRGKQKEKKEVPDSESVDMNAAVSELNEKLESVSVSPNSETRN